MNRGGIRAGGFAPALLALTLAVAALAAVIWLELRDHFQDSGAMTPSPVAALPAMPTADRPAVPDAGQIARWAATSLARPLFSPGRRPPAAATPAAAGAAPSLPRIAGVVVTPAGRRAIFAMKGAKPLVVGEGGQVAGFTVESIRAGEVVLRGPEGERVLTPTFDLEAPAPTALPDAPPPAPGGGLTIPGLPGFRLAPPAPGLGGIPGLPASAPPSTAPRAAR